MRIFLITITLLFFAGCSAPTPTEPPLKLSQEYLGQLGDEDLAMYLEQDGYKVEGRFLLANGDLISGKLDGTVTAEGMELKLYIPPAFIQAHRLSPVIHLRLSPSDCPPKVRKELLKSVLDKSKLKEPEKWVLFQGETTFNNYDKEQTETCRLLNVAMPGNVFNK